MRSWFIKMGFWSLSLVSASVMAQSVPSSSSVVPAPMSASTTTLSPQVSISTPEQEQKEIKTLQTALVKFDTKHAVPMNEDTQAQWQDWAQEGWKNSGKTIDHDQAVVVVNRNAHVQEIAVMIAHPNAPWTLIGVSRTSTGQRGRVQHFITPTGVFDHDGSIMDYRALGTKNKYGIRGIGAKGSRVWDFGWQTAQTGWLKKPEMRTMRLELHATDPDYLEQRLGHPASEGCVRIGAGLNKFLDKYGILDAVYLSEKDKSRAIRALLPKNSTPILPGQYMIIVSIPTKSSLNQVAMKDKVKPKVHAKI